MAQNTSILDDSITKKVNFKKVSEESLKIKTKTFMFKPIKIIENENYYEFNQFVKLTK
jgi:hypothetical protein